MFIYNSRTVSVRQLIAGLWEINAPSHNSYITGICCTTYQTPAVWVKVSEYDLYAIQLIYQPYPGWETEKETKQFKFKVLVLFYFWMISE